MANLTGGGSPTRPRQAKGDHHRFELVKDWKKVGGDTWKVTIPDSFFGKFNPYADLIHGDWFNPQGRQHHTGCVYLNGDWLMEATQLDDVLKPAGVPPLWFAQVNSAVEPAKKNTNDTVIYAQFPGVNPNGIHS